MFFFGTCSVQGQTLNAHTDTNQEALDSLSVSPRETHTHGPILFVKKLCFQSDCWFSPFFGSLVLVVLLASERDGTEEVTGFKVLSLKYKSSHILLNYFRNMRNNLI